MDWISISLIKSFCGGSKRGKLGRWEAEKTGRVEGEKGIR
jgi:hypothetical protein